MSEHKLNLSDAMRSANRKRYLANKRLKAPVPALYLDCKDSRNGHGRNQTKRLCKQWGKISEQKQI